MVQVPSSEQATGFHRPKTSPRWMMMETSLSLSVKHGVGAPVSPPEKPCFSHRHECPSHLGGRRRQGSVLLGAPHDE